jgi:hypothetical protein
MSVKPMLTLGLLTVGLAVPAWTAEDFHWQGKVAPGGAVEIKGINGGIQASAASGDQVEVTAVKRARHGNPDEVEIKVVEHAGGVTICALYPGSTSDCQPGESRHTHGHKPSHDESNWHHNDTEVEFTVRVPSGTRFIGRTVNGGIEASALPGDAEAYTVNGGIKVEAAGHAVGATVNGGIRASLGRADWTGALDFKTVNGGITLELPAQVGAELKAQTVNGEITSDFPLTVQGGLSKRQIAATIGSGGRQLTLSTVNGGIHIRKAP